MISKLHSEGRITDEEKENLKGKQHTYHLGVIDMIFNEDSILLSFFDRYEDEEELKGAIQKYCRSNIGQTAEEEE